MFTIPPLSLYLHYPWCQKKCPYCDFNSHIEGNREGYLKALLSDLETSRALVSERPIESIFIGGGTPSLFPINELKLLFLQIRESHTLAEEVEITLECNPGTMSDEKIQSYLDIGINRLSIGAQSFNDQALTRLGRIHTSRETYKTIEMAQRAGFKQINLDLMYALPEQCKEDAIEDLEAALSSGPTHVSYYQLTIEPNTYWAQHTPVLPSDDMIFEMGEVGATLLEACGFPRYEVSAYGESSCRHNLNYWQFGDYLGLGAGAHGKITDVERHKIWRTQKPKSPKDYIACYTNDLQPQKFIQEVEDPVFEFMLGALRLHEGFALSLFEKRTNVSWKSISSIVKGAQTTGLLDVTKGWVRPTQRGRRYLNDLQAMFL